jgi:ABC-type cobalamin transport system permease subunit
MLIVLEIYYSVLFPNAFPSDAFRGCILCVVMILRLFLRPSTSESMSTTKVLVASVNLGIVLLISRPAP